MSIPSSWELVIALGDDSCYDWVEWRVYQDTTTGDFFTLWDGGCSCNYFDEDDATQSGPFHSTIRVVEDWTQHGDSSDYDAVPKIMRAVDDRVRR